MTLIGGNYYSYYSMHVTRPVAKSACGAIATGVHLVDITSQAELDAIDAALGGVLDHLHCVKYVNLSGKGSSSIRCRSDSSRHYNLSHMPLSNNIRLWCTLISLISVDFSHNVQV